MSKLLDLDPGLEPSHLRMGGPLSHAEIRLPAARGHSSIRFEGPLSDVTILLPFPDSAVRLRILGPARDLWVSGTSVLHAPAGLHWQTPDWQEASHRYDLLVDGPAEELVVAPDR